MPRHLGEQGTREMVISFRISMGKKTSADAGLGCQNFLIFIWLWFGKK